jgi:hypothetical protein
VLDYDADICSLVVSRKDDLITKSATWGIRDKVNTGLCQLWTLAGVLKNRELQNNVIMSIKDHIKAGNDTFLDGLTYSMENSTVMAAAGFGLHRFSQAHLNPSEAREWWEDTYGEDPEERLAEHKRLMAKERRGRNRMANYFQ